MYYLLFDICQSYDLICAYAFVLSPPPLPFPHSPSLLLIILLYSSSSDYCKVYVFCNFEWSVKECRAVREAAYTTFSSVFPSPAPPPPPLALLFGELVVSTCIKNCSPRSAADVCSYPLRLAQWADGVMDISGSRFASCAWACSCSVCVCVCEWGGRKVCQLQFLEGTIYIYCLGENAS